MLVRVLAQELWPHNISVNELVPGPVLTERVARSYARKPGSVFQDASEWVKAAEDGTQSGGFRLGAAHT